ncbi:MAG: tRNA uridine-5-carboxymethylaminomethyl(34) synthesis GTPase MnmE [Enterobacterales bacterium]
MTINKCLDTIIAIATPIGCGGIGILRISGILVKYVANKILGKIPLPRYAEYLSFKNKYGNLIDKGIVLFFPKPNSFTGEDVLELHGHGGPIVLDMLLKEIISIKNIRIANPGEFSERAFMNNKIDLLQAEAICDLINATSEQSVKSSINSLQGFFSKKINVLSKSLINLRAYIEASIDFSTEEINVLTNSKINIYLNDLIMQIKKIYSDVSQGIILKEGITIVIFGIPNVGKSSLLNILTQKDTAIVTNIAGTTRDILKEHINIEGMPVNIIDTAGVHNTNNKIELIGIEKTWNEIKKANHILYIVDSSQFSKDDNPENIIPLRLKNNISSNNQVTIIRNKSDITKEQTSIVTKCGFKIITISARYGYGIKLLKEHIKKCVGFKGYNESMFIARRRHLEELKTAIKHLKNCKKVLEYNKYYEIISEELHLAHKSLYNIMGKYNSNDLLKKIFSDFCIGK